MTQSKSDQERETNKISEEIDLIRHDVAHRANNDELMQTKEHLTGQLNGKVDLEEVQTALNECQNDIVRQLDDFKEMVQ